MLSGKLPRSEWLLDSLLVGLSKTDGSHGVRPIAIGEAWYRLVGTCVLEAVQGVGQSLAPLQLGVGVSGGVEAAGIAVRAALAQDDQAMALKLDIANCFNSLKRSAVFRAVQRHVPDLLPFVQWAYGGTTNLHIVGAPTDTAPVASAAGVKQGDPLGMLLAGLTLHSVQERVHRATNGAVQVAVADDITLVGRAPRLRQAWACLNGDQGLSSVGAALQPRKSALTGGSADTAASLAREMGVVYAPEGIMVAGTPVGTPAFVAHHAHQVAEAVISDLERLERLPLREQSSWLVLHGSLSKRMLHLQRVVPWEHLHGPALRVQGLIALAGADLFRLEASDVLGANQRATQLIHQLGLPHRVGGFGLGRITGPVADAAFVACHARAQLALKGVRESALPLTGVARGAIMRAWEPVFDKIGDDCGWPAEARALPPEFAARIAPSITRKVARVMADEEASRHLTLSAERGDSDADKMAAARLRSAAGGPASAWLTALPAAAATRLTDDDFVTAGRHPHGPRPRMRPQPGPLHLRPRERGGARPCAMLRALG